MPLSQAVAPILSLESFRLHAARLPSKASVNPLAVKLALIVCFMIAVGTTQSITTISEGPKCNNYSEMDGNVVPRALELEEQSAGVSLIGRSQVNVFLHVIASSNDKKGGVISNEALSAQMDVINESYAPARIDFRLQGIDKTIHKHWASGNDALGMKKKLRKGTYRDLNLYFVPNIGGGNAGLCNFPRKVTENSDDYFQDGCTVLSGTIPGGSIRHFNQGKTAVHEIGHWLGLLHTFTGGCNEKAGGDLIADTPAQAKPTKGCSSASRGACGSSLALESVYNYMDYAYDDCMREFTSQQISRMHKSIDFRASQVIGGP